jgi:hypothetical protein
MKSRKHIHYKNPTIIEAVVEIRFAKSLENNDNQKLEKLLGSKYECKKDELVIYTAAFNPSGLSLQHDRPGQIRLKFTLGSQTFVQVYPDRFSFHWVGKYPGWDIFEGEFEKFRKQLCKALPGIMGQQVGIRFINKLDQKTIDQKVGLWLKVSPNYPKSLLSVQGDYFYRCKWPLRPYRWAQVGIAEAELTNQCFRPLMFDSDIIHQIEKPLKLDSSFSKLTSDLHDEVYDIFESSISVRYKKILNTGLE